MILRQRERALILLLRRQRASCEARLAKIDRDLERDIMADGAALRAGGTEALRERYRRFLADHPEIRPTAQEKSWGVAP